MKKVAYLGIFLVISLSVLTLYPASPASAIPWTISMVDTTAVNTGGDEGWNTSIAVDSSGNIHVSYYYPSSGSSGELRYAKWSPPSGPWTITTVPDPAANVGKYSSIAVDGSGNVHISYRAVTGTRLKYAMWDPVNGWRTQDVDATADVGTYSSIAVDSSGNAHISYYDFTNNRPKYAKLTGSGWDRTVSTYFVDGAGVGRGTSIALDSSGNPHISYYNQTAGTLKYAMWNGSGFNAMLVEAGASGYKMGQYNSIAVDSSGNAHISYYNTYGTLRYTKLTGPWAGSPLRRTVAAQMLVDSTGDVGKFNSIVLDSSGNPRISYRDATNGKLKYAKWNVSPPPTWLIEQVTDLTGDVGTLTSIDLDSCNNPYISYYDYTHGQIKCAIGDFHSKPTAQPSSNSPVCEGGTIQLYGGPPGMTSYNWYGPDGWTSTSSNENVSRSGATTAMAGDYLLSVFDGTCTSDNASTYVTVVEACEAIAPDFSVCQGTTLDDDLFTSNGAGCTGDGCTISGIDYSQVNVNNPDDYDYTVTCSNSVCADNATATGTVTVVEACEAIAPDFSICQGTTVDDALFINHGADCSENCITTLTYNFNSNSPPGDYPYSVTCSNDICEDGAANNANCRRVVVSDNNTMVTQGNGAIPHNAFLAWEPGPSYPNDGPDDSAWAANSLWDQNINYNFSSLGADWIWESYHVVNSAAGDVVYFQRSFNIPGTPIGATLRITCDNGYEVYLNGNLVGSAQVHDTATQAWETSDLTETYVNESGWQSVETWTMTSDKLTSGTNVLLIKAANEQMNGGTSSSNPGGLIFELVYKFTDACCCSDNATGTVTVNALPIVDAGDDQQVCEDGDPIDLTGTGESPADGTWDGPGISGSIFDPAGLTPGDYSVMYSYTDPAPPYCSDSDNKTVTIVEACEAIAPDFSVCQGTTLDDDLFTSNGAGCTGDNCTISGIDYSQVDVNNPDDYDYTVTCSNSVCTDNTTGTVTINTPPTVNLTGTATFCYNSSTTITTNVSNGKPPYTYNWTNSTATGTPSSDNTTYIATNSGIVDVTVTDDNGCTGSDNITVTAIYCGGGGGGGGAAETAYSPPPTATACPRTLIVNMLGKRTTASMTLDGVLCEDCLAFDPPKQNSWEAKAGTRLLLEDNKVPELIKVTLAGSSPPSGTAETIGATYEINAYASLSSLTPSPVTISPLFSVASAYDPNGLPKNISEVFLAYYPAPDQGWLAMEPETGAVAELGKARGTLNYFKPATMLAKLAELTSAKFQASNLTVSPSQIQPNQKITVSVNVANTGGESGDYNLELKVDGTSKATKQITLAAGASQTVNFTITGDTAGKHQIEVAGLISEFVVAGPPAETTTNWWLIIGGIIAGLLLILGIWMLVRWRRFSSY